MAKFAPEFDELIVSADLQELVDQLRLEGWSNRAILSHLASGEARSRQHSRSAFFRGQGPVKNKFSTKSGRCEKPGSNNPNATARLAAREYVMAFSDCLKNLYALDESPCFSDLVAALDAADRQEGRERAPISRERD